MQLLGLYDRRGLRVLHAERHADVDVEPAAGASSRCASGPGLGNDWTTYELRHSFVSLVADQLDDLVKVADLAGHVDTRTTQGYRHAVRPSLPHAIEAWDRLLARSSPG